MAFDITSSTTSFSRAFKPEKKIKKRKAERKESYLVKEVKVNIPSGKSEVKELYSVSPTTQKIESIIYRHFHEITAGGFTGLVLKETYWIECLGKHLCLPAAKKLESLWLNHLECQNVPFADWLESKSSSIKNIEKLQIIQLNDFERKKYEIHFDDKGVAIDDNGQLYSTEKSKTIYARQTSVENEGRGIYVIGVDKKIYASSHIPYRFFHSSFFSGGALIGAGELMINGKGKLIEISNRSGHYLPDRTHFLETLAVIASKGMDLSQVKMHLYQAGREVEHYPSAQQFLDTNGDCLPNQVGPLTLIFDESGSIKQLVWGEDTTKDPSHVIFMLEVDKNIQIGELPITVISGDRSTNYSSVKEYQDSQSQKKVDNTQSGTYLGGSYDY